MAGHKQIGYVRSDGRSKRGRWHIDLQPYKKIYSHNGQPFESEKQAQAVLDEIRTRVNGGLAIPTVIARYFSAPSMRRKRQAPLVRIEPWKEEYRIRMWTGAKQRAEKRGLPFNLTPADIEIPEHCPVLGVRLEPTTPGHGRSDLAPSLDRIEPALGYVRGNVVVISWRANRIKGIASAEELKRVVSWMEYLELCPPLIPED